MWKLKKLEKSHISIPLKRYLSWNELSIISVNKPKLVGVNIEFYSIREYRRGSYYAHILGYTSNHFDSFNKDKIISNNLAGISGIEKIYDSYLDILSKNFMTSVYFLVYGAAKLINAKKTHLCVLHSISPIDEKITG